MNNHRDSGATTVTIRTYHADDAEAFGRVIADAFTKYNLSSASPEERNCLLGPFRHAHSNDPAHRAAIEAIIQAPMMLVAERDGAIIGVLRGSPARGRLHSLFVDGAYHGQGIGRQLVARFEAACIDAGATQITLASSLYAVPFYLRLGYKKSTGARTGPCFDGRLTTQPVKKVFAGTDLVP